MRTDPTLARKGRRVVEPQPVPTLGGIAREPYWFWVYCERMDERFVCGHKAPKALAQFIIRWGRDASSDMIRTRLRCSKCGRLGCTIRMPSWQDKNVGWRAFPVEGADNSDPAS